MGKGFDKQIGEKIQLKRRQMELSIEQLSVKSGVDIATISRTENGVTQVTLDSAVQLCRVLALTLTELVSNDIVQSGGSSLQRSFAIPVGPEASELTYDDANSLLVLYRTNREACIYLIAEWLNVVARQLAEGNEPLPFNLDAKSVQLYLSKHDAFRFKVKYPEKLRIWTVETIFRLGGELGEGDISLLLSAIAEDTDRYLPLDRLGKETFWRLQTAKAERTRLSEVAKLAQELRIDLVGMYDNVEKLASGTKPVSSSGPPYTDDEARLISLFVAVCSWLRHLGDDSTSWLEVVRADVQRVKRTNVEHVFKGSGD